MPQSGVEIDRREVWQFECGSMIGAIPILPVLQVRGLDLYPILLRIVIAARHRWRMVPFNQHQSHADRQPCLSLFFAMTFNRCDHRYCPWYSNMSHEQDLYDNTPWLALRMFKQSFQVFSPITRCTSTHASIMIEKSRREIAKANSWYSFNGNTMSYDVKIRHDQVHQVDRHHKATSPL